MPDNFDEDLFLKGLEQRSATLGAEYVDRNLAAADDFTRPFQHAMTAWCWGFGWGDDALDAKTRSLMNLSMIGALGHGVVCSDWSLALFGIDVPVPSNKHQRGRLRSPS